MSGMNVPAGMLHPDDARGRVLQTVRPTGAESVELALAPGRVVAEDIVARDDHPPFPAATMDGYAVVSHDGSPWREITGTQPAGPIVPGLEVTEGYAVKIMTGAPLPPGADAVIKIEDVEVSEDHIVLAEPTVPAGQYIRPVGSDLAEGATVIRAGTRIGPVEVGLLATMGYPAVSVHQAPRVAVISTGDELVDPGATLEPGTIRDSNRFALVAALREAGAAVVHSSRVGDDIHELKALVQRIRPEIDVLVTSGGVSVGDKDIVRMLLGETAEVHFQRVFMKPGKPLTFATAGDLIIFGLPGNPVSSMVSLELFVRPALLRMQGANDLLRPRVPVLLADPVQRSDRIEYQRAFLSVDSSGRLVASTTGNQISSRLASMLGANALLIVDPGDSEIPAGEMVEALLIDVPRAG
ncbi:MAG: molybdopterin molybdotransferase MoeA [Chloroflexota bacterium]|nr:molybdopterin molybdotransferase MoeA [Chloroflexota bacterium]